MEMDQDARRQQFLGRLSELLSDLRTWAAADPRLTAALREFAIDDPFGHYTAPGLEITITGERLASVVPVAAVVIGAEGRVDVKGPIDQAAMLYLSGPGRTETTIEGVSAFRRDLFAGFEAAGWYWMLDSFTPHRAVRRIDADAFRDIVLSVSDYEITPSR
ncbi:MAG: hypothetical protein JWM87_4394 [Candidatus Eremiobacteraeota bacterium]|nr:hypothetical protein [Candidatus Eremiobacteraeota bacterium]